MIVSAFIVRVVPEFVVPVTSPTNSIVELVVSALAVSSVGFFKITVSL